MVKKNTKKSSLKVKDLSAKKNPKGGAPGAKKWQDITLKKGITS